MSDRGAKAGWIFGCLGGILWTFILAVVMMFRGNTGGAAISLIFFIAGLVYLIVLAPWKHPRTAVWKLYLGFVILLQAAALALLFIWEPGRFRFTTGAFSVLSILPIFIPVFFFGRKTWADLFH